METSSEPSIKGATPNIRTVSATEFDVLKNELLDGATVSGNYAGARAHGMSFRVAVGWEFEHLIILE